MTYIVERARKAASQGDFYLHNSLVYELIDEVERLRAALLVIANHSGIHSDFPHSAENLQRYARTALRGGK